MKEVQTIITLDKLTVLSRKRINLFMIFDNITALFWVQMVDLVFGKYFDIVYYKDFTIL